MSETFYRAEDVVRFLNTSNPARAKYAHRLEPRTGERVDTSAEWALIAALTFRTLKSFQPAKRKAFEMYALSEDPASRLPVEDISKALGRSKRQIYRYLNEVTEELERVYRNSGIIVDAS